MSLACLWCAVIGTGCTLFPTERDDVNPPAAWLKGAQITEQTDEGARIEVAIVVSHTNSVPLPLVDCRYTISIEGIPPITLTDRPNKTLPAIPNQRHTRFTSQVIHLPAAVDTQGEDMVGRTYEVNGSITYQPPGMTQRILIEADVPLPVVSFSGIGTLVQGTAERE